MGWKYLRWDETLFKNPEVFDPDYLPEEFLYRESQLSRLAANLKPAITGHNPVNCLCLGSPATGKTTAAKLIINDLEENAENVITAYVNCQVAGSRHKIFASVFERIFKQQPPKTGISTTTLYNKIFESHNGIHHRPDLLLPLASIHPLCNLHVRDWLGW